MECGHKAETERNALCECTEIAFFKTARVPNECFILCCKQQIFIRLCIPVSSATLVCMPMVVIISAMIYTAIEVGWGNNPKPVLLRKTEVNSIHETWRGFVLVVFNNADNFLMAACNNVVHTGLLIPRPHLAMI